MRSFVFWLVMLSGIIVFGAACSKNDDLPTVQGKIYLVDTRLCRLLPYDTDIIDASAEDMARDALSNLIEGRDDNGNIRRIIPKMKDCLTVRVDNGVAYVDIDSKIKKNILCSRDIEKLFIYQIVNTITSVKGIRFVRFTVDGEIHKDFLGFYDMRDTYKFTYPE